MNNITNAVQTNWKENTKNGLSKVEGVITSALELKKPRNSNPYYLAFFQLEGIKETEIPVIFKLVTPCLDCENAKTICQAFRGQHAKSKCEECREPHTEDCLEENKPNIPLRAKVLLEGH
jgi:DNA replicative helicase MCM subunit Mcm2 (Cdc46/Mcm family)